MVKDKQTDIASGFTKAQFLQSRHWQGIDKDILSVVLADDKTYTLADAKRLIEQFNNGEVRG